MADTFVNAVDVVQRTEDGIDVDSLSFDECIPFCIGKSGWSACCTFDPSFDCDRVRLEDVEGVSRLVATSILD